MNKASFIYTSSAEVLRGCSLPKPKRCRAKMHLIVDEEIEALELNELSKVKGLGLGPGSSIQPLVPPLVKVGTFSFLLIGKKGNFKELVTSVFPYDLFRRS